MITFVFNSYLILYPNNFTQSMISLYNTNLMYYDLFLALSYLINIANLDWFLFAIKTYMIKFFIIYITTLTDII